MRILTAIVLRIAITLVVIEPSIESAKAQDCLALFGAHQAVDYAPQGTTSRITTRFFPLGFQSRSLSQQETRLGNLVGEDLIATSANHLFKRLGESQKGNGDPENEKKAFLARKDTPNTLVLKTTSSILVMPHVFLLVDQVKSYRLKTGDFVGTMMIRSQNANDPDPLSRLNPHYQANAEKEDLQDFLIMRHGPILPTKLRGLVRIEKGKRQVDRQVPIFFLESNEQQNQRLASQNPVCIVTRRLPGIAAPIRYISPLMEYGVYSASKDLKDAGKSGWRLRQILPENATQFNWKMLFASFQNFDLRPSDEIEFTLMELLLARELSSPI